MGSYTPSLWTPFPCTANLSFHWLSLLLRSKSHGLRKARLPSARSTFVPPSRECVTSICSVRAQWNWSGRWAGLAKSAVMGSHSLSLWSPLQRGPTTYNPVMQLAHLKFKMQFRELPVHVSLPCLPDPLPCPDIDGYAGYNVALSSAKMGGVSPAPIPILFQPHCGSREN